MSTTNLDWRRHNQRSAVTSYSSGQSTRWIHKKLSCRRQAAQCFVSLNISLNHSRSLKVIRN